MSRGLTGGGALLAAVVFALAPLTVQAEPALTPAMQTTIASAIAGGNEGAAQDLLSSLARAYPELTPAMAAFTVKRLRAQDDIADRQDGSGKADDSRCGCVAGLTGALATAAPAHAGEVREAVAQSYPECDGKVTEAIEQELTGAPAGPGIPLSYQPDIPTWGPYGDPTSKCKSGCSPVEPPATNAASHTAL